MLIVFLGQETADDRFEASLFRIVNAPLVADGTSRAHRFFG